MPLTKSEEARLAAARKSVAAARATVMRRALNRTTSVRQNDDAELKTLANALRFLRQASGLTLRAAGEQAGCSLQQFSNIERGASWPSHGVYEGICRMFRVKE